MPWNSQEEKNPDGSQTFTYDYAVGGYLSSRIAIEINISADKILNTFIFAAFNEGIKLFKQNHPQIIPEGIGYIAKKTKVRIVLGILDNGAGPKSVRIYDNHSAKFLPTNVEHSMLERKQVILDILTVLTENYEFPPKTYQALKQRIENSFTFFGAVTMAKSRIENAKIFRSVAYYPDKEKLERLKAKKLGANAINLRSAMDKLLVFASGKKSEDFSKDEIEILTNEEKFIPLGKEASWLIALHKEFLKEMTAAAKNEALPSDSITQSYANILKSSIGSKDIDSKEEEEKIEPALAIKSEESTPLLLKENVRRTRQRRAPEPEPQETDSCLSCAIV